MPHRPNQRLPALPVQAAPQARIAVAQDMGTAAILQDILQELRGLRGQENFVARAALSQVVDHVVGSIDASTAQTNLRIPVPVGKVLTILDFPAGLTTFTVRIGALDAPAIDILRAGNQIRKSNPFNEIFVTTAPAITGATIAFMAGQAEIITVDRTRICRDGGVVADWAGVPTQSNHNIATVGPGRSYFTARVRHTTTTTSTMFNDIPADRAFQMWGSMSSGELSSPTDQTEMRTFAQSTGAGFLMSFGHVMIGRDQTYSWKTPVMRAGQVVDIRAETVDIGSATNQVQHYISLLVFEL